LGRLQALGCSGNFPVIKKEAVYALGQAPGVEHVALVQNAYHPQCHRIFVGGISVDTHRLVDNA
jgi:hypothetical protein